MKNRFLSPSLSSNCAYFVQTQELVETLEGFAILLKNLLTKNVVSVKSIAMINAYNVLKLQLKVFFVINIM